MPSRNWALEAALLVGASAWASTSLVFEAETIAQPPTAWLIDRSSATRWNLWSADKDAQTKWSGGVVLQGPPVKADRAAPEDGASPLRIRIPNLSLDQCDVAVQGGRTFAIPRDGRDWLPFISGHAAGIRPTSHGAFAIARWIADRYADAANPGPCYLDTISLTPITPPIAKPKVQGHAAARILERLDRGVVALPCASGVHVGWRLLDTDPSAVAFYVARSVAGSKAVRLTAEPIRDTTDFIDTAPPVGEDLVYTITPTAAGAPAGSARTRYDPNVQWTGRITLPLKEPITFQKCAVGDLDGDGAYDFVLKSPDEDIDPYVEYWKPSSGTYTLHAYRSDGAFLWMRDLGWAIERGTWYSPYIVYDFDGDGRAEVAAKIGEGDPRDRDGRVRSGPEWVVLWEGATGRELARAPWPDRAGFGDDMHGYNFASRNQLAVAYLDGRTPCLIALRGTYNLMKAEAWNFTGRGLRKLWRYSSDEAGPRYRGQGAHTTRCADIDGDGRDEVLLGSAVLDDTGAPLWSTGFGHPDHFYVGDLMPQRPGLEIYYGIETRRPNNGLCMVDAATGRLLWGWNGPTRHIHSRGICADICPLHPGAEMYGADSSGHKPTGDRWLFASDGTVLSRDLDFGFGSYTVYWDADLQREIARGDRVTDFSGGRHEPRIAGRGPVLVADILGDWREEMIHTEKGELRIYTTTEPAMDRRVTLMRDPIYRLDVAMASMGYTFPPTLSYDLESRSPNLNLTAVAGRPGAARIVAVASRAAPLEGELTLAAEGGDVEPSRRAITLAPGARAALDCAVTPSSKGRSTVLRAELRHARGALRGRVVIP